MHKDTKTLIKQYVIISIVTVLLLVTWEVASYNWSLSLITVLLSGALLYVLQEKYLTKVKVRKQHDI